MIQRPRMLNEPRETGRAGSVALGVLLALILLVLAFELWLSSSFFIVSVHGDSMMDTLLSGDTLYAANRFTIARGDIVVVDVSETGLFPQGDDLIIKRVIATEGDAVVCRDGVVSVRYAGEEAFSPLDEPYAAAYRTPDFGTVHVGAGQIFVLGDHRDDSRDSQDVGCLAAENVIGVVPQWAVDIKAITNAWEGFRDLVYGWFTEIFGG